MIIISGMNTKANETTTTYIVLIVAFTAGIIFGTVFLVKQLISLYHFIIYDISYRRFDFCKQMKCCYCISENILTNFIICFFLISYLMRGNKSVINRFWRSLN